MLLFEWWTKRTACPLFHAGRSLRVAGPQWPDRFPRIKDTKIFGNLGRIYIYRVRQVFVGTYFSKDYFEKLQKSATRRTSRGFAQYVWKASQTAQDSLYPNKLAEQSGRVAALCRNPSEKTLQKTQNCFFYKKNKIITVLERVCVFWERFLFYGVKQGTFDNVFALSRHRVAGQS